MCTISTRLPTRPTGPIVLEDGRPNPDRRLYISLIFFGMVEEIVTLRIRGLASESDVQGYERFIAAIMRMPVVQGFWQHSRNGYPDHVRAYLDPLAVPSAPTPLSALATLAQTQGVIMSGLDELLAAVKAEDNAIAALKAEQAKVLAVAARPAAPVIDP